MNRYQVYYKSYNKETFDEILMDFFAAKDVKDLMKRYHEIYNDRSVIAYKDLGRGY